MAGSASAFCASRVGHGTLQVEWVTPEKVSESFVSKEELGDIMNSQDGFTLKALTRADNFIDADYTSRTYRFPLGLIGECRAVDATIKLGYQRIDVLYLDELGADACLLNEIRAHEFSHVGLYLNNAQEARSSVEEILEWVAQPAVYLDSQQNRQTIKQIMENEVKPQLSEIFNKINARQAAFDSPQEYKRLSSVCL